MAKGLFRAFAALSLCLLTQRASPGKTAKPTPPAPFAASGITAGEVAIPFQYSRQHIYVTLSLNGKPGFIFMLDSGTNRNILNLRTARQLGIDAGPLKQEKNIGFGDSPIYIAPQVTLDADTGSLSVAHAMAVMDLTKLEQHFSHPTDGMLGYPFFRQFIVKVDFQTKLLTISPAGRHLNRGRGVQVRLKPSANFVIMPVSLAGGRKRGHRIDVAVDTGSDATLVLYEQFVYRLDLEDSLRDATPAIAFGLNGYYPVAIGGIDSFLVGTAESHNVRVDYLAKAQEVSREPGIAGAIGMGILHGFRIVIFDVPHRRILFEFKPPPPVVGSVRTIAGGAH